MNVVRDVFLLGGAALALVAGLGLMRFATPYARFHAAGKASPVAFVLVAIGASIGLGWGGAARLAVATAAMVLTLPIGVHLLFRATHRTAGGDHFALDELADAEVAGRHRGAGE